MKNSKQIFTIAEVKSIYERIMFESFNIAPDFHPNQYKKYCYSDFLECSKNVHFGIFMEFGEKFREALTKLKSEKDFNKEFLRYVRD